MADFDLAIPITLKNEGGFAHVLATGEIVNYGITADFLKAIGQPKTLDEIRAMPQSEAVALYRKYFWDAHSFGAINDQRLASKAFDLTVNMGAGALINGKVIPGGVTLLQEAANQLGAQLTVDGRFGAASQTAVDQLDAAKLYDRYVALASQHYCAIAAADPNHARDLPGWLARLER